MAFVVVLLFLVSVWYLEFCMSPEINRDLLIYSFYTQSYLKISIVFVLAEFSGSPSLLLLIMVVEYTKSSSCVAALVLTLLCISQRICDLVFLASLSNSLIISF